MNEALVKVIDFGFNKMKLRTIEAFTHENNDRSIQLLLRTILKNAQLVKRLTVVQTELY
jgi:ribosomal-protein-alanine N-acetyltransferase